MKKTASLIVIAVFHMAVYAQVPHKMSYQCVVRNSSGELVANQAVGMKISILQESATGTVVFSETYSPNPQTNANGLVTVEIGSGTTIVGSLSDVSWSSGTYFLKAETDPAGGTDYTITGTSQLLSVPYAMHARSAENVFSGNYNDLTNKPVLFDGTWASLTGKPSFATVATTGTYNDLLNKPELFDGTWNSLAGKPAGFADGIDNVDDTDNSITNEIQALSLSGTVLTLSNGGGSVTLPSSGGGDNWGSQVVVSDATLSGNGTTETPLRIADNGVSSGKIADGSIATADLANSAVTSPKLSPMGATSGQVLKWSGTAWAPANDQTGSALTLPFSGSATPVSGAVFEITDNRTSGSTPGLISAGLKGISNSTDGIGVIGEAIALTGMGAGVLGSANSPDGIGVHGQAPVIGVHGLATSSSVSETYGVYGGSSSAGGFGVYGKAKSNGVRGVATNTTGWAYGIYGESSSQYGSGVYGITRVTGSTFSSGVKGVAHGPVGRGVHGEGQKYGVEGDSYADNGRGVFGLAYNPSSIGVYGLAAEINSYGVYGESAKYGVYGLSTGIVGRAVTGEASGTSSIGVHGKALAENSTGVWGEGYNYDFYANGPGTNYGSASSVRWKENIEIITDPLEMIKGLRGVYFDWNAEHGGIHDIGFIAEEVGKVLPEIVVYEENGVDASGLDYSKITPLLLEAIKAQQEEIEQLKARLEQLEGDN